MEVHVCNSDLNQYLFLYRSKKRSSHAWRRRERQERHLEHTGLSSDQRDRIMHDAKSKLQPKLADMSPAHMAQTNWNFVEQLLKV